MPFYTIQELQRLSLEVASPFREVSPILPKSPAKVSATGLKLGFRIQWPQVDGVHGYRVTMMRTNNFAAAEDQKEVSGEQTVGTTWFYGDIAAVRQFTVQSFKRLNTGETLYSEPVYPFASATSKVDGGAADGAAVAPQAEPIAPSGAEDQGDPGGIGRIS